MNQILKRLISFYHRSSHRSRDSYHELGPTWAYVLKSHFADLVDALNSGSDEKLDRYLKTSVDFLYGIDEASVFFEKSGAAFRSSVLNLAKNVGILPIENPEQPSPSNNHTPKDFNSLCAEMEKELGVSLRIKNQFGHRVGEMATSWKNVLSIQAMNSARRRLASGGFQIEKVLEIGGGAGYCCLLAYSMGAKSYTVIDLPEVAVISAYFIAKTIGEDSVWLAGESERAAFAKYFSNSEHSAVAADRYNLILNCDSIPEMPRVVAGDYLKLIPSVLADGGIFLSINHESDSGHQTRVFELKSDKLFLESRNASMMRGGYIEEVYVLKK